MAATLRKTRQDEVRDKIKVGMLLDRLNKHLDGEIDLEPSKLKAIEMMLDRTIPKLMAVEQTIIEPERSESDILQELQSLISANPDLIRSLLDAHEAAQAAQARLVGPVVEVAVEPLDQATTLADDDRER